MNGTCLEVGVLTRGVRGLSQADCGIKAGQLMAEAWLAGRHDWIDFWGCDEVGEVMIKTFLAEVDQAGALDEIPDLNWWAFGCETGLDLLGGKSLMERTKEWIAEYRSHRDGLTASS